MFKFPSKTGVLKAGGSALNVGAAAMRWSLHRVSAGRVAAGRVAAGEHRNRLLIGAASVALFGGLALGDVGHQAALQPGTTGTAAQRGVVAEATAPADGADGKADGKPASRGQERGQEAGQERGKEAGHEGGGQKGEQERAAPEAGVPSSEALMPNGVPGGQVSFAPNRDQRANADKIIEVGQKLDLPPRAQVIAVATSLQETHLNNYGHLGAANDHDSLGLFQQRPSSGWGTPDQLTDPEYAARAFYASLARVPGYQRMPLTDAAQTVQVSAYPDAYAKWERMAADLVTQYHSGHR